MTRAISAVLVTLLALLTADAVSAQSGGTAWSSQEAGANEASDVQGAIDLIVRENDGKSRIEYKNFMISFGASVIGAFNTEFRVDSKTVPILGTRLNLEDDLGFDSTAQVLRIDAAYAFNRYHRIDFSWFDIKRDSTAKTTEEIRWGDYVLPPTKIDLHFNTTIVKLAYRYNFIVRDDWDIGFGVGIHWMDLDTGFRIRQEPAEGDLIDFSSEEDIKQGIPLPVLGLHGNFAASDNWRLFISVEGFFAKLGDYKGLVLDTRIGVDWMFADWMGVGLYYNAFQLDVEADSDDWKGEAEYSYHGLVLSVSFAF